MRTATLLLLTSLLALLVCACTKRHEQIKTYMGEYEVVTYVGGYVTHSGEYIPLDTVYYNGSVEKKSYRKLIFHCDCSDHEFVISINRDGDFTHKKGDYEGGFYQLEDTLLITTFHYQDYYRLDGPNMWFIKK